MTVKPCVFCEIVAGRSPATIVGSTPTTLMIVPLGPVVDGHILAIPKVHVRDAAEDLTVTSDVLVDVAAWAGHKGVPFNLITSAGREATQSIFHLHWHYVPRAADDGLMVPWGTLHGENPQDPHRCRRLRDIDDITRRRGASGSEPAPAPWRLLDEIETVLDS